MLLAGSVLERLPGPKYTAALRFAELHLREPLPRIPTLRRQRADTAPDVVLALRAPARAIASARGPLRFDEQLEAGLDWLIRAADALSASVVLLPTPIELTPGQRSRDLLREYAARLPRERIQWVWSPRGPWEPDDCYRLARSLDLGCAFDPLEQPAPHTSTVYARLTALGARKNFPEQLLGEVHELMETLEAEHRYVAIESARSFDEAVKLQRAADGEDPSPEP